jgi:polysaccharide biosynthesis/export protein
MRRASPWKAVPIVILCAAAGCGNAGRYVWVNDLPPDNAAVHDYRIHVGDALNIKVFEQETMATKARVRSDGRIAFPIIGDVEVRGKRPVDVSKELEARLKDYIVTPHVTVTVEESQPISVSVVGEVNKPGIFVLDSSSGVAQALASAGGTTDFADHDSIFVVRTSPSPLRVRFTYHDVTRGEGRAATFLLQPGDLVVVE